MSKPIKILYLFAGKRRKLYEDFLRGEQPDTALVGLNHLAKHGISAEFFENSFTEFFRKISFNLTQLPVLPFLKNYDVVFSGSGLFTLFIAKVLLRFSKPKWFIYNTYLSNLLKRNRFGVKAWFIKRAIASADGIICPSTAQRDFLASEGFDQSRLFFIPYGVDSNFYSINKLKNGDFESEKYIISAGRDVGRDYATLIEAISGTDIKLIIGALPRNFPNIDRFPKNVEVNYYKPRELASLVGGSEFVVIPTIPEEKMVGSDCSGQYVLLESMMLGKAIITTKRETLTDYFQDKENGLLVPPENACALRDLILRLWRDPSEVGRMGINNATQARPAFSTEKFAEQFSKIIHDVLNR